MLISLVFALAPQLVPQEGPVAEGPDPMTLRVTPEVLVARSARPAVVYVETEFVVPGRQTIFGWTRDQIAQSGGSGVVIFDDGYVVTNYHVVANAENIRVRFDEALDPVVYDARLISAEPSEDLALLKIESEQPFPTVPMGRSNDLMIAEPVIAIGNPYGQSFTVSRGIISGLHRNIDVPGQLGASMLKFEGLIQTDASINPGNSGGPLLNINGELIGINTAMNQAAENIGFAIPVDRVREVLFGSLLQASTWFGIEVQPDAAGQARILEVKPDSPGALAGLQAGDLVRSIDGKPVTDYQSYTRHWVALSELREVPFEVDRGEECITVSPTPWSIVDGVLHERFGMRVEPRTILNGRQYVTLMHVTSVREGGPASRLGVLEGDLIERLRANNRRYFVPGSLEDLAVYASELPERSVVEVDMWRDKNENLKLEYTEDYSERLRGELRVL